MDINNAASIESRGSNRWNKHSHIIPCSSCACCDHSKTFSWRHVSISPDAVMFWNEFLVLPTGKTDSLQDSCQTVTFCKKQFTVHCWFRLCLKHSRKLMKCSLGLSFLGILDPETGPQTLRTLFLSLLFFLRFLLLSDFPFPKAPSFLNRSSWNFHTY